MHNIPDLRVCRTADEYQEIALLCHEHKKAWGGSINAALAIEIYLKSFLSEEVKTLIGDDIYQGSKKTKTGHNLFELYNKIDSNLQSLLCEQYNLINSNSDLPDLLKQYKDVFLKSRYIHEINAIYGGGSDIIFLAKDLRDVVINVAKIVHPPIVTPPNVIKAVAKHNANLNN
jgi:hypothetical protein